MNDPRTEPDQFNPEELAERLNQFRGGFNEALDLRFVRASTEEIVAQVKVREDHHQPYGLVHGGVYASMIETVCSTGAALFAMPKGQTTVGLENTSSFLRATRSGTLTATATPVHTGNRSQVWRAQITDDEGRVVSTGQVRLMCLEPGAALAGQAVGVAQR